MHRLSDEIRVDELKRKHLTLRGIDTRSPERFVLAHPPMWKQLWSTNVQIGYQRIYTMYRSGEECSSDDFKGQNSIVIIQSFAQPHPRSYRNATFSRTSVSHPQTADKLTPGTHLDLQKSIEACRFLSQGLKVLTFHDRACHYPTNNPPARNSNKQHTHISHQHHGDPTTFTHCARTL